MLNNGNEVVTAVALTWSSTHETSGFDARYSTHLGEDTFKEGYALDR
jgi:hypothetical protein